MMFVPNFEYQIIRCPNPLCESRYCDTISSHGTLCFLRGVTIEVFVQRGMETVHAFVLGSRQSFMCFCCGIEFPVPCLFPSQNAAESFWNLSGLSLIEELWNEIGERKLLPSFLGRSFPDQGAFDKKYLEIKRYFPIAWGQEAVPFVFLEDEKLGYLSRANTEEIDERGAGR